VGKRQGEVSKTLFVRLLRYREGSALWNEHAPRQQRDTAESVVSVRPGRAHDHRPGRCFRQCHCLAVRRVGIGKATRGHQLALAREERNYASRKTVYAEAVASAYRNVAIMRAGLDRVRGEEEENDAIRSSLAHPLETLFEFLGALNVVGGQGMIAAYESYARTASEAMGQGIELGKRHSEGGLTTEELEEMEGLVEMLRLARNELAEVARQDLHDAPP
jgi:hypothetical protein